jgi:hypothetical protein
MAAIIGEVTEYIINSNRQYEANDKALQANIIDELVWSYGQH